MHISHAQMATFEQASWRRFVATLADYLSKDCATLTHACDGATMPRGPELQQAIESLIAAARSFGLTTELGLGQFVIAGLGYSMTFHSIPMVADWLRDPGSSPEQNMQRVINAIVVAESKGGR